MAKQKAKLYEEMVFDDVQLAVDTYNACKRKMKKVETGLIFAIIATICNLLGWIPYLQGEKETLLTGSCVLVGLICTFIAYIKGGGILTPFRWAWKLAKFTWIMLVFPFDIFIGLLVLCYGFAGFAIVPVIFVYMNYRQIKMDYQSARQYISYYKAKVQPTQNTVQSSRGDARASVSRTNSSSQSRVQTNSNRTYGNTSRTQSNGVRTYR